MIEITRKLTIYKSQSLSEETIERFNVTESEVHPKLRILTNQMLKYKGTISRLKSNFSRDEKSYELVFDYESNDPTHYTINFDQRYYTFMTDIIEEFEKTVSRPHDIENLKSWESNLTKNIEANSKILDEISKLKKRLNF
jgi:hypothetical protein